MGKMGWSGSPKHTATKGSGAGPAGAARTVAASSGSSKVGTKVKPQKPAPRSGGKGK